jgi:hypothetical protein
MNAYTTQNPFDPQFDPDTCSRSSSNKPITSEQSTNITEQRHSEQNNAEQSTSDALTGCHCGLTRRQTLLMAGSLMALPLTAAANPLIPCVQTQQKITPCQHKFCRHYRGDRDYYGR